ncbi:MAG: sulfur carrier protein ThiS [Nitrososphaerota archaeon]
MAEVSTILVNGSPRPYLDQTIFELLKSLGLDPERAGIAVAINGEVVARNMWRDTRLRPSDRVEVVTAIAGG